MDQMFDRVLNEPMCLYNSRIEEYNTVDIVLFSGNQIADTEAAVRQMFFKIVVLTNFTIFTGKHLYWSHYSARMRENTDQKNSEYEHFSLSVRNVTTRGLHKISCTKLIT